MDPQTHQHGVECIGIDDSAGLGVGVFPARDAKMLTSATDITSVYGILDYDSTAKSSQPPFHGRH